MYAWKCWRETRFFTTVFLTISAAFMPATAALAAGTRFLEDYGRPAFAFPFELTLVITSLWLGAIGALHGFDDQAIEFLFTKPRRRATFVWIGWAVGVLEMLAIALVNLFAGWLTISRTTSADAVSKVFGPHAIQDYADVFVLALMIYSLTYAFTAVLRNGVNGLGASLGSWIGYFLLAFAVRWRWNINLPYPFEQVGNLSHGISSALWLLIALCFILAAQQVVERAEV